MPERTTRGIAMNRSIGRLLILGMVGLALSLGDYSIARAQWSWWGDGYPGAYSYGVGYSPYWGTYSTSYWPSSYYVGYGSYSLWPSYSWGRPCCGSSCCGSPCGGSCCGGSCYGGSCGSWCGSSCCASAGCCGGG